MNKEQILEILQAKNKNLRLPSGMGFSIENKVLTITMEEKGLTANMQTDASAFEGWAICLKAWLPELINNVTVERKKTIDTSNKHYQRFLYRLDKFIKIYSWVHTVSFEKDLNIFREKNRNVVINVPKSEASISAARCEAQLERFFCQRNKEKYDVIDQQLPVRLFNDEIKDDNAITPKSYLDIWGIKDTLLRIFELKLRTNTEIGIISELMFYMNVMTDVIKRKIKIPFSSKDKSYRSFKQLFEFLENKKCKKIEGVFLADNLHSGIKNNLDEVLHIINGGNFSFNTEYLYEKPQKADTIMKDDSTKRKCMKQEGLYKSMQKKKQLELLQHTDFFENAIGCGIWWNKKENKWEIYPHILQHQDSLKNLYAPIRQEALNYFKEYDIAWWRADEDRYFPTGHLLSSQIHCLNHLFKLRTDPEAVLSIIKKQCPNIEKVLPSPIDQHEYVFVENEKKRIDSYITFEFTYNNVDLLKERTCKRGKDCTSIDALVYAEDRKGKQVLIAIEWKYTETYAKNIGKEKYKKVVYVVKKRYLDKIATNNSHLTGWEKSYYLDPFYELARQSLLMEQIISKEPFPADYYQHIVVCPTDNKEMRADASAFKESLSACGKEFFHIIDPQELLAPLRDNKKYEDLITYLETRYWK